MIQHWEVIVLGIDLPVCILAYTKSQAIQTAVELFPGINPQSITLWQQPQWK